MFNTEIRDMSPLLRLVVFNLGFMFKFCSMSFRNEVPSRKTSENPRVSKPYKRGVQKGCLGLMVVVHTVTVHSSFLAMCNSLNKLLLIKV